ncbi:uncharacterized protein CTHT_0007070 [Thermochaetoides thermophila DSM 1495]|uniref:Uncharacterized protein n=1 Tax=Chaetomium thermophilum (strain DSM 1495 / CBS 144.50 / IMI 039719) TaxID=759272 RepID=G0RYL0_CHATD|nr:hypothetical protein CTHT_0007070 [Thermochaetoides thermophila DSM 1495]EGS23996.1 hypothetical protein CTHT_0007070 [Thermochaetoides thermophila DSM 1495]
MFVHPDNWLLGGASRRVPPEFWRVDAVHSAPSLKDSLHRVCGSLLPPSSPPLLLKTSISSFPSITRHLFLQADTGYLELELDLDDTQSS